MKLIYHDRLNLSSQFILTTSKLVTFEMNSFSPTHFYFHQHVTPYIRTYYCVVCSVYYVWLQMM